MIDISTIYIDNEEYYLVDKIRINDKEYYCLINVLDNKKVLIRRLEIEQGKTYLSGLDNEEEFNLVLEKYINNMESKKSS